MIAERLRFASLIVHRSRIMFFYLKKEKKIIEGSRPFHHDQHMYVFVYIRTRTNFNMYERSRKDWSTNSKSCMQKNTNAMYNSVFKIWLNIYKTNNNNSVHTHARRRTLKHKYYLYVYIRITYRRERESNVEAGRLRSRKYFTYVCVVRECRDSWKFLNSLKYIFQFSWEIWVLYNYEDYKMMIGRQHVDIQIQNEIL